MQRKSLIDAVAVTSGTVGNYPKGKLGEDDTAYIVGGYRIRAWLKILLRFAS
jgi:hypothetical protein